MAPPLQIAELFSEYLIFSPDRRAASMPPPASSPVSQSSAGPSGSYSHIGTSPVTTPPASGIVDTDHAREMPFRSPCSDPVGMVDQRTERITVLDQILYRTIGILHPYFCLGRHHSLALSRRSSVYADRTHALKIGEVSWKNRPHSPSTRRSPDSQCPSCSSFHMETRIFGLGTALSRCRNIPTDFINASIIPSIRSSGSTDLFRWQDASRGTTTVLFTIRISGQPVIGSGSDHLPIYFLAVSAHGTENFRYPGEAARVTFCLDLMAPVLPADRILRPEPLFACTQYLGPGAAIVIPPSDALAASSWRRFGSFTSQTSPLRINRFRVSDNPRPPCLWSGYHSLHPHRSPP